MTSVELANAAYSAGREMCWRPSNREEDIGLWVTVDGECECGVVHAAGQFEPLCVHRIACKWGIIDYPKARPWDGEVGKLVLVDRGGIANLLTRQARGLGDNGRDAPALSSVTVITAACAEPTAESARLFYNLDYGGQRWTWELHRAHWVDRPLRRAPFIGRWPD